MPKFEKQIIRGTRQMTTQPPAGSSGRVFWLETTREHIEHLLEKVIDTEHFAMLEDGKVLTHEDFLTNSGRYLLTMWLSNKATAQMRSINPPLVADVVARMSGAQRFDGTNKAGEEFARFSINYSVDELTNIKPYDAESMVEETGKVKVTIRTTKLGSQGTAAAGDVMAGAEAGLGAGLTNAAAIAKAMRLSQILGQQGPQAF